MQEGRVVKFPPLQLVYLAIEDEAITHHQVLFCVPKKRCKRAVDRNKLKRTMREAYRLHKHQLLPFFAKNPACHLLLAYLYVGNETHCSFATIQTQMLASIAHLNQVQTDQGE